MVEQVDVLFWLSLVPLMIFSFAAILVGSRPGSGAAVRSSRGGEGRTQNSLLMAGFLLVVIATLVTLLGRPVAAVQVDRPLTQTTAVFSVSQLPLGLLVLSLGGFVLAAYLSNQFGEGKWGGFMAKASQESAVYWAVLGIAVVLIQRDVLPPGSAGLAALWLVISVITVALFMGTFARLDRHMN